MTDKDLDPIDAMYAIATESEMLALDDLRLRAGLAWKCHSCGWFNTSAQTDCEGCGLPRHKVTALDLLEELLSLTEESATFQTSTIASDWRRIAAQAADLREGDDV